jgi:hypothetical protein
MKTVTHAITVNGRIHGELWHPTQPLEDLIRRQMAHMDGTNTYSASVWRLPLDVPLDKVNCREWPQEYIQAAGSSERMTVEIRRLEDDGARQYVIGRSSEGDRRRRQVTIKWNAHEVKVFPNEVFTADEAAEAFIAYLSTDTVPETYSLRLLDL